MKKRILIALVLVLALAATASLVWAGGGPNGTFVHFDNCYSYWLRTGSGLLHEWRYGLPSCGSYAGESSLHLVFKPVSKFEYADCDDEGYLGGFKWTAHPYTEHTDDEGDLTDFLNMGDQYWVCFYEWGE